MNQFRASVMAASWRAAPQVRPNARSKRVCTDRAAQGELPFPNRIATREPAPRADVDEPREQRR